MKNTIVTITGPSGIGKTCLKRYLKDGFDMKEIAVYTTRKPREDDRRDERVFLSEEEFEHRLDEGKFSFVNELFGHKYAFETDYLKRLAGKNERFIAEVYIDNARGFRGMFPSANMIALLTKSPEFLECRLKKRSEESVRGRLESANIEIRKILENKDIFDLLYDVDKRTENFILGDIGDYVKKLV